MSKAILVMDMPEKCDEHCPLYHRVPGDVYCAKGTKPLPMFGRPGWCPLIPEPERREHGEAVGYTEGKPLTEEIVERLIDFGFNECLDEIEIATEGKT